MMQLTPEQITYKEHTLQQLMANYATLEAQLEQEAQPNAIKSIQRQMSDIEEHMSRLQDELNGVVLLEASAADELFKKVTRALAKEKFHLARRYINKLETIEPFYPGLDRLKEESNSQKVSRRTRSIAQGTASSYAGITTTAPALPVATPNAVPMGQEAMVSPEYAVRYYEDEASGSWFSQIFQFHIIVSCLVVMLVACVMLALGSISFFEWFITGL